MNTTRWLTHFVYQYDSSRVASFLVQKIELVPGKVQLTFHLLKKVPSWLTVKSHLLLLHFLLNSVKKSSCQLQFKVSHFPKWFNLSYSFPANLLVNSSFRQRRWVEKSSLAGLTLNGLTVGVPYLARLSFFDFSFWNLTLQTSISWASSWNLIAQQSQVLVRSRYV